MSVGRYGPLMRTTTRLGPVVIFGTALGASACASTQLAAQWRNPDDAGAPMKRLLVVAPNARSNADRIVFESRLSDSLRQETGAEVKSLFQEVPQLEELSEDQMQDVLTSGGYDGVLTVRLLDIRQKVEVTTTPTGGVGYGYGYGWWWRNYFYADRQTVRSVDVLSLEVNLHRVPGFDLAWTARTESVDVLSPEQLAQDVGDVVAKAMVEGNLVLDDR